MAACLWLSCTAEEIQLYVCCLRGAKGASCESVTQCSQLGARGKQKAVLLDEEDQYMRGI